MRHQHRDGQSTGVFALHSGTEELIQKLRKAYDHPSIIIWRSCELVALNRLLRTLELSGPLLDLGCGDGSVAASLFREIDMGLDLERASLERALSLSSYSACVQGDARAMPFKSQSFGVVFSNSVIEHIPGLENVLAESSRILRGGGHLLVTTPSVYFAEELPFSRLFHRLGLSSLGVRYGAVRNRRLYHFNILDSDDWKQHLSTNDLEVLYLGLCISGRALLFWDLLAWAVFALRPFLGAKKAERLAARLVSTRLITELTDALASRGADMVILAKKRRLHLKTHGKPGEIVPTPIKRLGSRRTVSPGAQPRPDLNP